MEEFSLSWGPSSSAAVRVVLVHDIKEEKGEKQKEVHEAGENEEKESEVDGEVGERERVAQRAHDDETNKAQKKGTVQQTRTTLTTKKRHYEQTSSKHSRLQLLFS